MYGVVLLGQNVPAWLRFPRRALDTLLVEEVHDGRKMGGPDEFLLLLREVSAEKLSPIRQHPGVPVRDRDARKNIRRILVELLLYGFADIRGDRCDVDKAGHAVIDAGSRDGGTSVGMSYEKNGAANTVERVLDHGYVCIERLQTVLNSDDLMAVRLQCGDDLAEARAVGPNAVAEHDGWFALISHELLLFLIWTFISWMNLLSFIVASNVIPT